MPQAEVLLSLITTLFFLINISFEQVQSCAQKKSCIYNTSIVGMAGLSNIVS
tara:strand:- start:225 stop:380 length:156 start_codon:yes stop_codon:yes gene_type:complete